MASAGRFPAPPEKENGWPGETGPQRRGWLTASTGLIADESRMSGETTLLDDRRAGSPDDPAPPAISDGVRKWRHFLQRLALTLLAGTLLFGRQLGSWSREWNRFCAHWRFGNALSLMLWIVLPALLAVGIDYLLDGRRFPRLRLAYHHLFLLVLGSGLISNWPGFHQLPAAARDLIWFALAGAVTMVYILRQKKVLDLVRQGALLFTLLTPIIFIQMLAWNPVGSPPEPLSFPEPDRPKSSPVFIFLFDEWSYLRSIEGDGYRPELTHTRDLCRRSFVFGQAQ